jgi:hypothetical protein
MVSLEKLLYIYYKLLSMNASYLAEKDKKGYINIHHFIWLDLNLYWLKLDEYNSKVFYFLVQYDITLHQFYQVDQK